MTQSISIDITGAPVAKGRPRMAVVQGRARAFTPAKTRSWENDARQLARIEMGSRKPFARPISCVVIAYFVPPKSWPAWKRAAALNGEIAHTGKPDVDNIVKAVKDALNGVVWTDDAQVVELAAEKRYGERARVWVKVSEIEQLPSQIKRRGDLAA